MSDAPTKLPSLTPIPGKVYLKRVDAATAPSPYVIPDASKEKSTECIVIAIPSKPCYEYGILVPCPVDPGDRVIVGKYSGEYDFRSQKIVVVRWDEILAVIDEADDPDPRQKGTQPA